MDVLILSDIPTLTTISLEFASGKNIPALYSLRFDQLHSHTVEIDISVTIGSNNYHKRSTRIKCNSLTELIIKS